MNISNFFDFLTNVRKFHSPKELKYLNGDFSKVRLHLMQQLLLKRFLNKFKYSDRTELLNMTIFFDFVIKFLQCFKSSTAQTS
jgi:hypothetical protein